MTIAVKLPETTKVQSRNRRIKKKKIVITEFSGECSNQSEQLCFSKKVLERNKKKENVENKEA